jgi:hypothetical protein
MKIRVIRDRDGQVVSTIADEGGDVSVEADLEEGQDIETIELPESEISDPDALHKRLQRSKTS